MDQVGQGSLLNRKDVRLKVTTLLAGLTLALSACGQQTTAPQVQVGALAAQVSTGNLGPNVTVLDPSMSVAEIKAKVDAIAAAQFSNEFGPRRDAIYFKPGTYGSATEPLNFQVGYYTEVAGLGASPTDVVINGTINVYNRCLDNNETGNCLALTNFWRSMSNLTIKATGGMTKVLGEAAPRPDWCTNTEFWAVSQAAPLRRVNVIGGMSFMDYCSSGPQYASGGFMADSRHSGADALVNGSQQQWYTRNSQIVSWSNAVWSAVFSGVVGAPAETFPTPNAYTVLDTTPVSREKPYLFVDASGQYNVRVPSVQVNSRGITWGAGMTPGRTVPLSDFYVATPSDSVQTINNQLARGRNLILTPGVYSIDQSIAVKRADTVVLGLGYATLTAANGATPITVADVPGVVIAGITLEAGPTMSQTLMRVGTKNGNNGSQVRASATNPTTLSDVFLRVGGAQIGKVDAALEINSDNVLIDHTWVWRADHGVEGPGGTSLPDTQRWAQVIGNNGVVVNGNNVTATGLFVEHFQKNNVVWNGENGKTIFFQNELPYDPPTQEAWNAGNGGNGEQGWAAYRVADTVRTHQLYGGGAYVFNQNNPSIHTTNGFEAPATPGVRLHHLLTVNLSAGTIDHVVNGVGGPADTTRVGQPVYVTDAP
ncbi:glycosyl hydrolase family 28-related protein [Deinococcus sonorensis]